MSRGRQGRGSRLGPAGGSGGASPRGRRLPSPLLATGCAASLARLQRRAPRSRGSSWLESSSLFDLSHARAPHLLCGAALLRGLSTCPAMWTRSPGPGGSGSSATAGPPGRKSSPALLSARTVTTPTPAPWVSWPQPQGHQPPRSPSSSSFTPLPGASRVLGRGDLGEGGAGEERGERERAATSALLSVSAPLSPTVKEIPRQLGSGEAIHLHKHPSSSLLLETTDRVSLVAAGLPEGSLIKSHFSKTAKPRPSHLPRRQGQVSLEGTEAGGGRRGEAGSAGVGLPTPGYRAVQGSGPEVNGKAVGQRSFRGLREWPEHL